MFILSNITVEVEGLTDALTNAADAAERLITALETIADKERNNVHDK